ncbi:EamA family transporter [candidate division GN15 bacterium]|nr:EamA family transporter [candidate division GN15 bacterium]
MSDRRDKEPYTNGIVTATTENDRAESENRPATVALIAALITQQLFGAMTFPISKFGLAQIEPLTFAFYRFILASIALLTISHFQKHRLKIVGRDRWKIVGLGLLIIPFNQLTFLIGQSLTGANHGGVIFSTAPIWVFILAIIHLKEQLVPRRAVGVVFAVIGVITIMSGGALVMSMDYLWGDLLILVAVIAWAYYTVWGKPLVQKYGAIRVTAYALTAGALVYVPFGLWRAISFDYTGVGIGGWLSVLYISWGLSGVVYILWYWVLKYMAASRIAVWHNVQPIIATAVAYFWLNEPLGWSFIIGGTITLTGVVISEWPRRRRAYYQESS